jgi:hypothetical protein
MAAAQRTRAVVDPFSRMMAVLVPWPIAQPAGSASARACVKSPESRIAFPLTDLRARPEDELDPLHRGTAQAEWHESPPSRLFTRPRELSDGPVHNPMGEERKGTA